MRHIADFIAERLSVFAKVAEFFQIGIFVNPVNSRNLRRANLSRDRFVGGEHEFFDELMRNVVDVFLNANWPALFVEAHFDFREIEIQRAGGEAL